MIDRSDLIFWTDILTDHATFQINAFSPKEEAYIREALNFQVTFDQYHKAAQATMDAPTLNYLMHDVAKFIDFKKDLIANLMQCNVLINFTPGFINHMVNEASEFLSLLSENTTCATKTKYPSTYIKTWVADAGGHAAAIIASLDHAETLLLENAQHYKTKFDNLCKKSMELEMIQDNLEQANYFLLKAETLATLKHFIAFCKELSTLLDNCNILSAGTFGSAMTNHFIKEHEYVIKKLNSCM